MISPSRSSMISSSNITRSVILITQKQLRQLVRLVLIVNKLKHERIDLI